jgi:hypothetical protein
MLLESKAARVKEITLKATFTAHRFYQKMGFEDVGPETTVEINGQKIRCYPMKMRLEY